ncbi:MAG: type II toxin-antitoxin system RelE/ParE family toxin [Chitinophagaceae bacterium]|nr:type II toxin-antitoxin system RelE/ParE family toxin [Chitinophagaceae bacterium]
MNFKVETILPFEKEFKKLYKKYPSLKNDLLALIQTLETKPTQGISLGNNFYKIRLAIQSKSKGKSGGARIITFVKIIQSKVYLVAIYDKSVQPNITKKELQLLLQFVTSTI